MNEEFKKEFEELNQKFDSLDKRINELVKKSKENIVNFKNEEVDISNVANIHKLSPKAARVNAGLTIIQASKLTGISIYKLSQIEYGKKMKESERVRLETTLLSAYKLNAGDIAFA